jgi:hypothetical protein
MSSNGSSTLEEHDTLVGHSLVGVMDLQARGDFAEEAQELLPQLEGNISEALESHEVIELQAFIERKEWIEDKIKVSYIHLSTR